MSIEQYKSAKAHLKEFDDWWENGSDRKDYYGRTQPITATANVTAPRGRNGEGVDRPGFNRFVSEALAEQLPDLVAAYRATIVERVNKLRISAQNEARSIIAEDVVR